MRPIHLLLLCSFAVLLAGCDRKQSVKTQAAYQVEFDLLVVQIPEAKAVSLIPALRDKNRASKAVEEIVKLINQTRPS
jgi:hypothetical protein